ncbi:hypothetical protein Tco_0813087 [Tanacetum coccineum]
MLLRELVRLGKWPKGGPKIFVISLPTFYDHSAVGLKVTIPGFNGDTLNPEGFIDWLVAVEEVFVFKEVPENKRVSLIATKLRGKASAWWKQLKLTRERVGKPRITSWQKIKKCASGSGNAVSRFAPNQAKAGGGNTRPVPNATSSSGLKCFNWVNLLVRRYCLTPKADGDDWFKHNIFQLTCTILGKVCTFVCDSGSCDNLIAEEAIQKLGLKTKNHPKPYKLQWLKKGGEFEDELEMGDDIFVLIGKEVAEDSEILEAMIPLLDEFTDVFPDELPDGLPPLHDIQHHIDLVPG